MRARSLRSGSWFVSLPSVRLFVRFCLFVCFVSSFVSSLCSVVRVVSAFVSCLRSSRLFLCFVSFVSSLSSFRVFVRSFFSLASSCRSVLLFLRFVSSFVSCLRFVALSVCLSASVSCDCTRILRGVRRICAKVKSPDSSGLSAQILRVSSGILVVKRICPLFCSFVALFVCFCSLRLLFVSFVVLFVRRSLRFFRRRGGIFVAVALRSRLYFGCVCLSFVMFFRSQFFSVAMLFRA